MFLLYPSTTFRQVQEVGELVQENPPGTNLIFLRSSPQKVFLQLSVLPSSSSRFLKEMHIFREPEILNVSTGTSRSPGLKHAWYKWLNGSRNSDTWFPEDEIPIFGMIKRKRPYIGNWSLICWQKHLNFYWFAWIQKKQIPIRNMVFGLVSTPAKHILLVHINMSQGLNIHQGLKISYTFTHK